MQNVMNRIPCNNGFCTSNQRGYCINISENSIYREHGKAKCDRINDNNFNMDEYRRKEDLYYQENS